MLCRLASLVSIGQECVKTKTESCPVLLETVIRSFRREVCNLPIPCPAHTVCARDLYPLSDLAREHPQIRQVLVVLGHVLLRERITQRPVGDLVRYHICRVEQVSGDADILARVWQVVRGYRSGLPLPRGQAAQPLMRVVK